MIHVLSKETIDQIAAGEVIERPESVVKELLDNAVDSGASGISVEIREGGLSLIRVTDNGCGIAKEDIPVAFLRHATSKLSDASDLYHIKTMGFRGEALASICGVSEVELVTKEHDALLGYRYRIAGGKEIDLSEIGAPDGTSMIVRNLFYNVPVRKSFLKSKSTEASYIADIVEKTALAHPDISVSLLSDGRTLLHTSGNGRLKDVIYTIYGREVSRDLLALHAEQNGIVINGFIGKPVIARAKREFEVYFVNGRYIRSSVIEHAIEDAYDGLMMQHRFPFAVLKIDISAEEVDVNVHPKKMEVRFSDNQRVYEAVRTSIRARLKEEELIIDALLEQNTAAERPVRTAYGAANVPVSGNVSAEPFETKRAAKIAWDAAAKQIPGTNQYKTNTYQANVFQTNTCSAGGVKEGRGLYGIERKDTGAYPKTEPLDRLFGSPESQTGAKQMYETKTEPLKADSALTEDGSASVHPQAEAALGQQPQTVTADLSRQEQSAPLKADTHQSVKSELQERLDLDRFLAPSSVPQFELIGQVFKTYWIVEYKDSMYLIDQHAAHEKVNYERYMKLISEQKVSSQMLLPPILLKLSPREAELVEKYKSAFGALGYEFEPGEGRDIVVRAVPANLPGMADKEALMELVDSLRDERTPGSPERLREKVASMSCKAAVKGNRVLTRPEMEALIGELLGLENPYACPHGRPTIAKWTKYEIDKLFKRIV